MQYTVNLCSCLLKSLHRIQRNPLSWAWIRTLYYQMSIPPIGQGAICREKTNFFIANPIKTILSLTTLFQSRGLSPIPLPTTNHTLYIWMIYIWMKTSRGTELLAETRASQLLGDSKSSSENRCCLVNYNRYQTGTCKGDTGSMRWQWIMGLCVNTQEHHDKGIRDCVLV